MNIRRMLLLVVLLGLAGLFFNQGLDSYLTLAYIKSQQEYIASIVHHSPVESASFFVVIYIAVTALSLPGAAIMTLAAGAMFGMMWGTALVSIASTAGATLAMLASRYLFRESVQNRFNSQLEKFNQGIDEAGAFYLFTLRLVPVVPFFIINLVMGLTRISVPVFFLVSQVGMFAGTLVYVNAGTRLADVDSLAGILSLQLIAAFALLGILPLLSRRVIEWIKTHRSEVKQKRKFQKPDSYDRDLVVIGAGSGGLVSAYIAATLKAKVTLIEKHRMGGDCLNTGCVPSKALIRSAKFASDLRRASEFGFKTTSVDFDFKDIMQRIQRVIETVAPHDSVERYKALGVDVIQGRAKITSPYSVEVNGETITTRNIIIATGARPTVPQLQGIDQVEYFTSDTVWSMPEHPGRLIVLGGGPIGTELAQSFARLDAKVTQIEQGDQILGREDKEISALVHAQMSREGVDIMTGHRAIKVISEHGAKLLEVASKGARMRIPFDHLLVALGRSANTKGFGLEELGIATTNRGTIQVNEFLQTNYSNIYAVGDVAGPYQFTHVAAHQAWYATVNALLGIVRKFKVDYSVIPWSTFSSPEVARVGLNEKEARLQGIAYECSVFNIEELDRAIADESANGLIKVLTKSGSDKILGVTIAGEHAGDLISEYVLAMKHGLGLNKIMGTIHIYPTLVEMNKYVAGEWRKNHKPERLLQWLERYHCWRRGQKGCFGNREVVESAVG
ncbi:MAG: FAD-dependent oxidoreductase [Gammaproteobacteria bacterium]|nr:FAD-dependent oxidoreductase [Gammaproteobacteria bacterium]